MARRRGEEGGGMNIVYRPIFAMTPKEHSGWAAMLKKQDKERDQHEFARMLKETLVEVTSETPPTTEDERC